MTFFTSIFAAIAKYLRQSAYELSRVVWPTVREWRGYTVTVIVFCLVVGGFVALLDFAFTEAVFQLFA